MTDFQQLTILKFQIAAALLMGLDYFIPDSLRETANRLFGEYVAGVQNRTDQHISNTWKILKKSMIKILISVISLMIAIPIYIFAASVQEIGSVWISLAALIIFFVLIIIGLPPTLKISTDVLAPLGLSGTLRLITTYILSSPKGPLAATGFILLACSFALRYSYLNPGA